MENPFRHFNRYRYAWDLVPTDTDRLLDFGCYEGDFTNSLSSKVKELFGVDVNNEALTKAKHKYPHINFILFSKETLPFPKNYFDVVTLLDVLEHVPNEEETIKEIHRVLRPNGMLVLSTPHKGLFAFLDAGNIKFRFPRLHRFFYLFILKKKDYYYKRFVDTSDGLVGDISVSDKMWHKHYSLKELSKMLEPQFEIVFVRRFGLLVPVLSVLSYFYRLIFHKNSKILEWLINFDLSKSFGMASYNIIICCRKR